MKHHQRDNIRLIYYLVASEQPPIPEIVLTCASAMPHSPGDAGSHKPILVCNVLPIKKNIRKTVLNSSTQDKGVWNSTCSKNIDHSKLVIQIVHTGNPGKPGKLDTEKHEMEYNVIAEASQKTSNSKELRSALHCKRQTVTVNTHKVLGVLNLVYCTDGYKPLFSLKFYLRNKWI